MLPRLLLYRTYSTAKLSTLAAPQNQITWVFRDKFLPNPLPAFCSNWLGQDIFGPFLDDLFGQPGREPPLRTPVFHLKWKIFLILKFTICLLNYMWKIYLLRECGRRDARMQSFRKKAKVGWEWLHQRNRGCPSDFTVHMVTSGDLLSRPWEHLNLWGRMWRKVKNKRRLNWFCLGIYVDWLPPCVWAVKQPSEAGRHQGLGSTSPWTMWDHGTLRGRLAELEQR